MLQEDKSKMFDKNSGEVRDMGGWNEIINMQGGGDKIKTDRNTAG